MGLQGEQQAGQREKNRNGYQPFEPRRGLPVALEMIRRHVSILPADGITMPRKLRLGPSDRRRRMASAVKRLS
jgi:hypothetical protein